MMMPDDEYARIQSLMRQICDVRYSDLELEREYCEQLLELGEHCNNASAVCFAHTYLGDYHYACGNFFESEQHLIRARSLCALHSFDELLLNNHMFSGHLYRRIGNEPRALDFYLDGIALAQALHDTTIECNLYNSIAVIYHSLGELDEAMHCLETAYALPFDYKRDDTALRRHIFLLSNIAELACFVNQRDKAKVYLKEAEDLIFASNLSVIEFGIIYSAKLFCIPPDCPAERQAVLNELFALKPETWLDKSLVFDLLIGIGQGLLALKEYSGLEQVLNKLAQACEGTEYALSLTLRSLHIQFWRETGNFDAHSDLYQDFYNAYLHGDRVSQEVRAAGLIAKRVLRQTLQEKADEQAKNKLLEAAAYYDALTLTYNRHYMTDFLQKLQPSDLPRQVCVAMIDLDYFKEYNDTYGHQAGDNALRSVAKCLLDNLTGEGFVLRYGGDEFSAIYFDRTDEEIESYFKSVREMLDLMNLEHKNSRCLCKKVSLSIGYHNGVVQTVPEFEQMLANADKALYMSKYKGRNAVTRFEEKLKML